MVIDSEKVCLRMFHYCYAEEAENVLGSILTRTVLEFFFQYFPEISVFLGIFL